MAKKKTENKKIMQNKIAVLMGGHSLERQVSLKSGHRVADALEELGYKVNRFDVSNTLADSLKKTKPDLAYIALHGKDGEDGTIQELLDILKIPYTGPGVYASILGFDKVLAKETFIANDIPTAPYYTLSVNAFKEMGAEEALDKAVKNLGLPVVIKPARQGSALGIKIAHKKSELPDKIIEAFNFDDKIILEKHLKGKEVSVSILGKKRLHALPSVEIRPHNKEYFDFESMYSMGKTDYFIPAQVSTSLRNKIEKIALKVHKILHCRDISRTDMIIDKERGPQVLEVNTSPGMTETSLLPMTAAADNIPFETLVDKIVKMALKRS